MISRTRFLEEYPEFGRVAGVPGSPLPAPVVARIDRALDAAAARIDAEVFGETTDEAHGLLTAAILSRGATGQDVRIKDTSAGAPGSVHQRAFDALAATRACGLRAFP